LKTTVLMGATLGLLGAITVRAQDSFNQPPEPRRDRPAAQTGNRPPKPPLQQPPRPAPSGGAAETAERQDQGVTATNRLHDGAMHGPTPNSIPGGQLITTPGLLDLLKAAPGRVLVFDVLGAAERLPGALNAVPAHQAGSFDDAVQREFGQFLQQVTQGKRDTALVFYCASTQCWMSYNAALRAIRMGYRNVLWYRGGLEAWKAARQPVQTAQAQQGQQPSQGPLGTAQGTPQR
jgi:PQQ-dependent catabolism-associated CXXCW motif protein